MSLSAERITAVIFDPQTPPEPQGLRGRLARLFGRSAATAPRRLSLREARNRLIHMGLPRDDAYVITNGVESMMHDELRNFIAMQAYKSQSDLLVVSNIDWSDRHYLGVSIKDKGMDFEKDAAFIADVRAHFMRELSEWLHSPASSRAQKPDTPGSPHA